ncbi:hypothetical protein ACOMHN_001331 [Nucella lapillus]
MHGSHLERIVIATTRDASVTDQTEPESTRVSEPHLDGTAVIAVGDSDVGGRDRGTVVDRKLIPSEWMDGAPSRFLLKESSRDSQVNGHNGMTNPSFLPAEE